MLNGYKILVYCTSKIHENNFNYFISSFNDELILHGWRIMIFCTFTDLYSKSKSTFGEANIFELINYDIADAIFISDKKFFNQDLKNSILQKSKKLNIPTFVYDGTNPEYFNIGFNQKSGIKKITKHIIENHKITDLHFISGIKGSDISNFRLEAFKEALKEAEILFDDSMVSYGDFWDEPTKKAVQKLIDKGRIPKAFICANDAMAIAAISVLKKNGFNCPKDVLVTGYDGIDEIFYSVPKITSALCNFQTLGTEVAKFILEITENFHKNNTKPFTKYIEPTLMISESCGCSENALNLQNSIEYITNINNYYNLYREEEFFYSQLSFSIQECKSFEEIVKKMHSSILYDVKCLLKAECAFAESCPSVSQTENVYGDSMYVLFDSDSDKNEKTFIKTADLLPQIDEVFKTKKPIIFAPLNHVEVPLCYLAFCFKNYNKENSNRVMQVSTWLSNAIFGFKTLQYQQFLKNRIEKMYSLDALTGLYNRMAFLKMYDSVIQNPSFSELTLVMCDLDNLKIINDNFGHTEGDIAIKTVANAFLTSFDDGIFCRYGGDEILGLFTKKISFDIVKKKIDEFLNDFNENSGKKYKVSAAIGVYTSCEKVFSKMLSCADNLMYKNKVAKKNKK